MANDLLTSVIAACPSPERAGHYFRQLATLGEGVLLYNASQRQLELLAALFSGSLALGDLLVANPSWLSGLEGEALEHPRRKQALAQDLDKQIRLVVEARNYEEALARVRRFKQFEMLRIAARDLGRLSHTTEIIREISNVADVCLDSVWAICLQQFVERFGKPYHPDATGRWHETAACVLGLGKLGGQELNYSSDVDLMFVYADEGQVFRKRPARNAPATPRVMSSHQYFNRLAEAFISEVTRLSYVGALYRVDLRLRPEGDAGPLCRSLESCENYYAQWGQTWERMMLIKARLVAGDAHVATEFLEMIQSFRFPRSLNEGVLREIAAMKDRIEDEVVRTGELDRNVKLGRGGIREIEFVVQAQQLLHAGRQPFLQNPQTLASLAKLVDYGLLDRTDARTLAQAYCFLRDVEHRLQMEENRQTHTLPTDAAARLRIARLMGCKTSDEFESLRVQHTTNVRKVYDRLLKGDRQPVKSELPERFEGAEAQWKSILERQGFRDASAALRVLKEFVEGPGFVHVSPRTSDLARQLLPRIFGMCPGGDDGRAAMSRVLSDPDRVLTRIDSFITAYGTRAALFDLWTSHLPLFELLLLLFDRSEFLAETIIRSPELYDELVFGDRLRNRKTADAILTDLRHGLGDDDQFLWLRRYHEAELLRLGSRDILGLVDFEHNLRELSALADACLRYALEVVMRKHKLRAAPFAIIGLGKLGGGEITYGSDLDILFVTSASAKELPRLQRFAVELMDLLSRRTEKGAVFQVDTRLRPDGEKGLLVNTLAAYEDYYRERAQLWEIQSLTRARWIGGNESAGKKFAELARTITDFSSAREKKSSKQPNASGRKPIGKVPSLPNFPRNWKQQIHEMRMRIERERTPGGQDELAIKTGRGGLMDAEFVAQTLCLQRGWQEPHTLTALERAARERVLPKAKAFIGAYRELRRVEGILRRWSYEGETVLPVEPEPYRRVSVRCGFKTPDEFRKALGRWRTEIRSAYNGFFGVKG